jgi:hypothetical protein
MPERRPDVEISASVQADELIVHEKPEVTENAWAEPDGESSINTERVNLPGSIEPGTVYRDIRIDHRIAARLNRED